MINIYVLQSLMDSKYYIGITKDLTNRIEKHNKGYVKSTKNRKPFKLIYSEVFENYLLARKREIEIKSYKGGNKFKKLIGV